MASRQQILTQLNLRRWLESEEQKFCNDFFQNLANYGGDRSAGFEWLIALMRHRNWDIERNALLRRPMSITALFLICQSSASGPFQQASDPDQNHGANKRHDDRANHPATLPDAQGAEDPASQ